MADIASTVVGLLLGTMLGVGPFVPSLWRRYNRAHPKTYTRDGHIIDGACHCTCPLCIGPRTGSRRMDFYVCRCPDCNQLCPGVGRLGDRRLLELERAETKTPLIGPEPHGPFKWVRRQPR